MLQQDFSLPGELDIRLNTYLMTLEDGSIMVRRQRLAGVQTVSVAGMAPVAGVRRLSMPSACSDGYIIHGAVKESKVCSALPLTHSLPPPPMLQVVSPVSLTDEVEAMLQQLVPDPNSVAHIVLPALSPEHWAYGADWAAKYPRATVWAVPGAAGVLATRRGCLPGGIIGGWYLMGKGGDPAVGARGEASGSNAQHITLASCCG